MGGRSDQRGLLSLSCVLFSYFTDHSFHFSPSCVHSARFLQNLTGSSQTEQYTGTHKAEAKQCSIKALSRLWQNNAVQAQPGLRQNSAVQALTRLRQNSALQALTRLRQNSAV
jgi:hypothetical protein